MAQPTHRNPILPPPAIEEYTPAQSLRSAAVNEFWEADRELQDLILSVEATKYRYEFHHKVLHVVTRTSHFQYQVVRGIDGLCTEGVARRRLMSQEREKWTGYMKEVAAVKKRVWDTTCLRLDSMVANMSDRCRD